MTLCSTSTASRPLLQAGTFCRSAGSAARCLAKPRRSSLLHAPTAKIKFLLGRTGKLARSRVVSRSTVDVRADASQISTRANESTTPPADLTQALAVGLFVAVRYNAAHVDAQLILRSLALLQLLVAGFALLTRGVHTDRVSGVIGPCALALYAINYSNVNFLTALTALFGYNLAEQLPGPYYVWALSLAGALYYGYGTWWYTAGVSILALWNLFKRTGLTNALASIGTLAVSGYVAYQEATAKWVMVLIAAQIAWSGVRTILGGINLAQ